MIRSMPHLSLREKAGQMICADFRFDQPDFERITSLVRQGIGGVVLFGGTVFETAPFVNGLQNLAQFPLLVGSDYENGVGQQVRGATVLPSNMAVGAAGSERLAELKGRVTAHEAKALGVPWILAPVLDLQVRADNPIINVRSFGGDAGAAARLGRAFAKGCRSQDAIACGKHFPGHGDVSIDSHLELPAVDDPGPHLAPFRDALSDLDSVMVAHIVAASLDPQRPATLSESVVERLLRQEWGCSGLVATDALMMGAITKHYSQEGAVVLAARAGCDFLLCPEDPASAIEALVRAVETGGLDEGALDRAVERIFEAKRKCGLFEERIVPVERVEHVVGCEANRRAAQEIAEASVTRVRGEPVLHQRAKLAIVTDDDPLAAFRGELERRGMLSEEADAGILALCVKVRAFSGRIQADPEALARARRELGAVRHVVAVAFGSPYVHQDVAAPAAVCLYDASDASQRAAARALAGEIPMNGKLPVAM
ncbi:MAG: hypothetical protein HY716_14595 [Planctomycetes bacterium]|nr:hypothetical protein [Planctomycetota bacterium]